MTEMERAQKLVASAPPLTAAELQEMNLRYTAYIFRRSKTREVWTTCCGRHETIPKKEYTDAEYAVMVADHVPEPKKHRYFVTPKITPCPYCGKEAYVKELGRTGQRDNLADWQRFVVLRWWRGALWARACYTKKEYPECSLTAQPEYTLHEVYRFKPGEATEIYRCGYTGRGEFAYITKMTERPKTLPLPIQEPFNWNANERKGYTIIGLSEVEKSLFRYCQIKAYTSRYFPAMRFLAVCSLFPRQVEMLMKAGFMGAVDDLISGRKWNKAAFDWGEANPLKSFGLDKNEMKAFLAGKKSLEALGIYKQFRRLKIRCGLADIDALLAATPYGKAKAVVQKLKAHRVEPTKWLVYIDRELQQAMNKKKGKQLPLSVREVARYWLDYTDAAVTNGMDMANPLVLMPKDLVKKHDRAAKAAAVIEAARMEAKREQARMEAEAKEAPRAAEAAKRYDFATERYLIRAPKSSLEIADEGRALKHCVGGYADRHLNGKLTILFLRDIAAPDVPLVTIEMNGARLAQIHGYQNDSQAKIVPREQYAEILNPWLEWVAKGSRRDKKGKPIIPRKKKEQIPALIAG